MVSVHGDITENQTRMMRYLEKRILYEDALENIRMSLTPPEFFFATQLMGWTTGTGPHRVQIYFCQTFIFIYGIGIPPSGDVQCLIVVRSPGRHADSKRPDQCSEGEDAAFDAPARPLQVNVDKFYHSQVGFYDQSKDGKRFRKICDEVHNIMKS